MPRSTYYYHSQAADEHELRAALQQLAGQWPRYGSRRLTAQLQREGFQVNRKHVQRLMRELGIVIRGATTKHRTTNSQHRFPRYANLVEQLEIVRPEQVWVCDITYIRLRQEFVYLAVVLDVFTRCIRGWHLGRSLDQTLTLRDARASAARPYSRDPSFRPRRAICCSCLYSTVAAGRSTNQHGRGGSSLAK